MISLDTLSLLDIIVIVVALLFIVRGAWIGLMRQLAAFLALIGSYLLAGRYAGELIPIMEHYVENPKLVFLLSFGALFFFFAAVFMFFGKLVQLMVEFSMLGWLDRLLGLALGVVKGAVVVCLLYMVLASSVSGTNGLLQESLTTPYLKIGAAELQRLIQDPDIRKYFVPNAPAIKAPAQKDDSPALAPTSEPAADPS